MGLDLDFDNGRLFGTGHRPQRLTTDWAMFCRFAHVMHFGDHRQGGTITATMPRTARLLAPLAGTGRLERASTVGTRSLLALGAIQALGQVADRGLQRFHVRLQGGFPLHQPLVLRLPVVCLPFELDVGLLRQHHCLLRKGRRASPLHWPKFGSRDRLWQGIFHGLGYSSFFWKVPLFLKGIRVNRIFTFSVSRSVSNQGNLSRRDNEENDKGVKEILTIVKHDHYCFLKNSRL